ncbi:MAG TPA: MerR family transcriptional regulator [Lacisediminihabitans sp.]|uniref:MerR family transcriptional regulator n=1 Tax=Lacisediminihabitans sp. TaxID=2787631 RepID=UPI002EDB151E
MRIGELARQAGVSVRSLRYYEEQCLLTSTRTSGGLREFVERDVERVRFIGRMYSAGLNSQTAAAMLHCIDSPEAQVAESIWQHLEEQRERINARIEDLLHTRDALERIIATNRRDFLDQNLGAGASGRELTIPLVEELRQPRLA